MSISIIGSNSIIAVATGGVFLTKLIGEPGTGKLGISPASILADYIIDTLSTFTTPTDNGSWPLYVAHHPDKPDDSAAAYDTTGITDARLMTGEVPQHQGVQLRIRATDFDIGYAKIEALAFALDIVDSVSVIMDAGNFVIENVSRSSPVIPLGLEGGTKRRFLFTVNLLLTIRKIA